MPNRGLAPHICLFIKAVRTVAATTFAAISPFQMILLRKYPISLFRKVKITLFQGNMLFHMRKTYSLPKVKVF